jgi:hypothetical protein
MQVLARKKWESRAQRIALVTQDKDKVKDD